MTGASIGADSLRRVQVRGFDSAIRAAADMARRQLQAVEAMVDQVMAETFAPGQREARSTEYQAGMRAALMQRTLNKPPHCPCPQASSAADAWYSGLEHGRAMWPVDAPPPRFVDFFELHGMRRPAAPMRGA